jgi:hypothetical protein
MSKKVIGFAMGLSLLGYGAAFAEPLAPAPGRPLPLEVVDKVIEQNDRLVQSCGRGGHRDTLAVVLHLDIDGEGRVVAADRGDPHLETKSPGDKSAVAQCLARVAKKIKFPATGVLSHVEYPFMLAPRR